VYELVDDGVVVVYRYLLLFDSLVSFPKHLNKILIVDVHQIVVISLFLFFVLCSTAVGSLHSTESNAEIFKKKSMCHYLLLKLINSIEICIFISS